MIRVQTQINIWDYDCYDISYCILLYSMGMEPVHEKKEPLVTHVTYSNGVVHVYTYQ